MGGVTKTLGKVVGGILGTGDSPSVEAPAAVDPEGERKKSEQEAAAAANAQAAERSRQRRSNSLLASGSGTQPAQTSSVLAYGKNKLGE
ncbi:MAG: hypothetical protein ACN6PJ_29715 [Achromobacter sp.]|uniref:hypothetical protein n=1 Tax=Achromobacter sp. TaxID=134375 RepID=UPI003D085A3F